MEQQKLMTYNKYLFALALMFLTSLSSAVSAEAPQIAPLTKSPATIAATVNTASKNSTLPASSAEAAEAGSLGLEDPFENFNRHTFAMNQKLDKVIFKPISTVYRDVLPNPLRKGVSNFFANLNQIPVTINDLLQGKIGEAFFSAGRFCINSTVGILGLFDVADSLGIEEHKNDFGVTLATWSTKKTSSYFVIPILGPSTFRDFLGRAVDTKAFTIYGYLHNVRLRNALIFTQMVSFRAALLDLEGVMHEASFDQYLFERDAYLQNRQSLILGTSPDTYVEDTEGKTDATDNKTTAGSAKTKISVTAASTATAEKPAH